jgi:hypothetical protein
VYSLNRHAYDELQRAHELALDDPEVQRAWFNQIPRKERIAAIESYLAGPHPDNADETANLKRYLDFLKAMVDKPVHACRLVTKVEQTDTKLEAMRRDPTHIFGYGLIVKLNDHDARLELDTGKGRADSHQRGTLCRNRRQRGTERIHGIGGAHSRRRTGV